MGCAWLLRRSRLQAVMRATWAITAGSTASSNSPRRSPTCQVPTRKVAPFVVGGVAPEGERQHHQQQRDHAQRRQQVLSLAPVAGGNRTGLGQRLQPGWRAAKRAPHQTQAGVFWAEQAAEHAKAQQTSQPAAQRDEQQAPTKHKAKRLRSMRVGASTTRRVGLGVAAEAAACGPRTRSKDAWACMVNRLRLEPP